MEVGIGHARGFVIARDFVSYSETRYIGFLTVGPVKFQNVENVAVVIVAESMRDHWGLFQHCNLR